MAQVGRWAFLVGFAVAIVGGIGFPQPWFVWLLTIMGLVVGFLNVTDLEAQRFLLAAIGLIVAAASWSLLPFVGGYLAAILENAVTFIGAAVLVVALRVLFQTAED